MLLQNGQFSVYIWTKNLVLQWKNKLEAHRSCSLEDMNCFAKIFLVENRKYKQCVEKYDY